MSIPWTILMISAFCLGLREISDDIDGGRLLYPLRQWFLNHTPEIVFKPIIVCCACMASFWGTVIYWLSLIHFAGDLLQELCEWETWALWIFCCVSASFINTFLWVLRNKIIGL